jgi:hypothetical protein
MNLIIIIKNKDVKNILSNDLLSKQLIFNMKKKALITFKVEKVFAESCDQ